MREDKEKLEAADAYLQRKLLSTLGRWEQVGPARAARSL
jgi:hypothetical protein